MALLDDLVAIERKLWTNDPAFYEAAFKSDAVLIFPEIGRLTRSVAVDAIKDENEDGRRWAEVRFDDSEAIQLSSDIVLLTYKATARWEHEETPERNYCSTIYSRSDGRWLVAFHQQAPIATT